MVGLVNAPGIAVVADDLTGAADSVGQFARNGYRTAVFFRGEEVAFEGFDAVALDTDSRSSSPDEARRRVFEIGAKVKEAGVVFKKVDSTLRGNVAVEINALMRSAGRERAIVAPAFPSGGRTTIGGVQLINGTPVHETEFSRDPKTPVREGHLPTLLSPFGAVGTVNTKDLDDPAKVRRALSESRVVVVDATEDGHLLSLVEDVAEPSSVVWVGSAGLASALASAYPGREDAPPPFVEVGNVLVVVGSVSGVSQKQLRNLDARGKAVPVKLEADVEKTVRRAGAVLEGGGNAAVYSPSEVGRFAPETVGEMLAEAAHGLDGLFGALVLTGGDTAVGVARRLGAKGIEVLGEVEPGVPFGRLVGGKPYPVVTKAGGFGHSDTLCDAVDFLVGEKEGV
ncbi:MAG: four-carbon acid sugar kinase family protein [Rubrobacteraceae bacterium]|nr:four-carbon acid sugar kinase family protein [Rubrobacter sp.]